MERNHIDLYLGDLTKLVREQLKSSYKNIWLVGGAMLAREFIRLQLADELRLSILPILLGEGVRLFDPIGAEQPLHLKEVTAYKSGLVELGYELRK